MRRVVAGAISVWLVSLLVLAPAASAAGSAFAGTWVSIDSDASTQTLVIGPGPTPTVTYQDFYANSCASHGARSTHFVASGRGTVDGDSLWVEFRNGGCGRHKIGPFGLGFGYDAGSDTLTDDFGITWYRFR